MKKVFVLITLSLSILLSGCSNKLMENGEVLKEEYNQNVAKELNVRITKLEKIKTEDENVVHFLSDEELVFALRNGSMKDMYILSILTVNGNEIMQEYQQMTMYQLIELMRAQIGNDIYELSRDKLMETAEVIKEEFNHTIGKNFNSEIDNVEKVEIDGQEYIQFFSEGALGFTLREGSMDEMYIFSIVTNEKEGTSQEYSQLTVYELIDVVRNQLAGDLWQVAMEQAMMGN